MAWRPYPNLIEGELSNRIPGKVTGWMRFFRRRRQPLGVVFDLEGDFHEDIRGSDIVLRNDMPTDKNISLERDGTYMEGFDPLQRGKTRLLDPRLKLPDLRPACAAKVSCRTPVSELRRDRPPWLCPRPAPKEPAQKECASSVENGGSLNSYKPHVCVLERQMARFHP